MRCTYCNYQNANGNKFCESCGKPMVVRPQPTQQTKPAQKTKGSSSGAFFLLIAGIVVIFTARVGTIVFHSMLYPNFYEQWVDEARRRGWSEEDIACNYNVPLNDQVNYGMAKCDYDQMVWIDGQRKIWESSAQGQSHKMILMSFGILQLIGYVMPLPWLYTGLAGGIEFTIKKVKGTNWWIWIFLFGLIPLALWLVFLAFMTLLGK